MFEISVSTHFSAAHHLRGYDGACADVHGHNWAVEVYIRGEELDDTGMLVDFRRLKESIGEVVARMDHKDLNQLDAFSERNPTSEHIAEFMYGELSSVCDSDTCRVHRVCVHESPGTSACYWAS